MQINPGLPLRTHQRRVAGVIQAIATGQTGLRDILAAVTPGGGKSLLPVIAASGLMEAGVVDRVCWIVPRDTLRRQAEEAFADPRWRDGLGHSVSVRAAENGPDPCRGLDGYVTTYQSVAAAPDLHLAEFRRHRYLLVVDELHHLPSIAETDPLAGVDDEAGWSKGILPLLECASVRLLLSGTLERADGRGILWLPYRAGPKARTREIDLDAPGWAVVGYSRREALAERAVLPVTFGALDGEANWLDEEKRQVGPHKLSYGFETARQALFTALRTEFAEQLLREAFNATRRLRAERRASLGMAKGETGPGLGKLLVVAPDQANARKYLEAIRRWLPPADAERMARLAVSDQSDAHENLAAFRLKGEPSILVTVAMAYEGMDVPEVAVCAALTHIRSRAWLEQMIARATRVDPNAGPWEAQRALVYHPDDLMFRAFREKVETEQGTLARKPKPRQPAFPFAPDHGEDEEETGIVPLSSNALGLRFDTMAPGPDFAARRPEREAAQREMLEVPTILERRLRQRIGEMVAGQVVEDDTGFSGQRGSFSYHRYNAVLKRVLGGKSRAEMTLAELEAAVAWLERNRISEHTKLLDGDSRYQWEANRLRQSPPRAAAAQTRPEARYAARGSVVEEAIPASIRNAVPRGDDGGGRGGWTRQGEEMVWSPPVGKATRRLPARPQGRRPI